MVNFCAVCGCCTRTDIVREIREHLEDTLRICDVSAMGLYDYDYDNSAHSPSWLFSDRLHQVLRLLVYLLSLDYLSLQQLWYYFPNYVYPNPPCQLPLWEETGALGENPRLSAERWPTLFIWVRSENQLRGARRLFWRLRHRHHTKVMQVQGISGFGHLTRSFNAFSSSYYRVRSLQDQKNSKIFSAYCQRLFKDLWEQSTVEKLRCTV
jgi:hypothetical protein